MDSAQIHLDLRLSLQLDLPPPSSFHSQGGRWGDSANSLGGPAALRGTAGHISPPSPGVWSTLAKPFSIGTTVQPPTRRDTESRGVRKELENSRLRTHPRAAQVPIVDHPCS